MIPDGPKLRDTGLDGGVDRIGKIKDDKTVVGDCQAQGALTNFNSLDITLFLNQEWFCHQRSRPVVGCQDQKYRQ
jgi:hypothetical protein